MGKPCRVDHVGFRVPDIGAAEAFFCDELGFSVLYGHGPYVHDQGRWLAVGEVADPEPGARHHVGHVAGTRLRLSMLGHASGPKVELMQLDAPVTGGWQSQFRREFGAHFALTCATADADPDHASALIRSPWGLQVRRRPVVGDERAGIREVTLPVTDPAGTTRLFEGTLGLQGRLAGPDDEHATLACRDCDVVLRAAPHDAAPEVARKAAHVAFYVDDMVEAAAALKRAGVSVDGLVAETFGPEAGKDSTYLHFLHDEQDYEFVSFPHGRAHPRAS